MNDIVERLGFLAQVRELYVREWGNDRSEYGRGYANGLIRAEGVLFNFSKDCIEDKYILIEDELTEDPPSLRGTGKTTAAIELAKKTGAYLVVRDGDHAHGLSRRFPELRFPMTFEELMHGKMCTAGVRNIVIDDIEDFKDMIFRKVTSGLIVENFNTEKGEK